MAKQNQSNAIHSEALEHEPDVTAFELDSPISTMESEREDAASTTSHYDIVSIPADFTLEGLVRKWKKKQLTIPGFQRQFVWTQRQASRLIESFLLGLPVPALFLYADPDTGVQQVIDGQQRLMSVVQFFKGHFQNAGMQKPRAFRLVGLAEDSPYIDLTFSQLEESNPNIFAKLNDSVMRAFMIKQLDPTDATSVFHIFERLNTGGTILLGQEIRNCIYHGSLNDLMNKLNDNSNWRKILGKPTIDSRMRDVEMILRFIGLYFFASEYKKPMKDFLSWVMKMKRNPTSIEVDDLRCLFEGTCERIVATLGEKPFHRGDGRMNPAVFDAVFTSIALHKGNLPSDLSDRYTSLVYSHDFELSSSFRTTDAEAVKKRLRLAEKCLFDAT